MEYVALVFSFLFLVSERFLRVVTISLPASVINFCYQRSRSLFNYFSARRYTTVESSSKEKSIVAKVRDADGFVDLCELWNDGSYTIEEHVVQTGDGYLLGLHRIVKRTDEEITRNHSRIRAGRGADGPALRGNGGRKVVYLHHGLLMNSEVWVCLIDKEQCLPFVLAELGYDVWLGNNRGNKYSKKSIHHPSNSDKFWNFSMDDFAFHDIPDSISYILETTHQPSLSYIGFSQGTAQAFATLSIHPKLNDKVDVFIALAPAMSPAGLSNTVVDALMKASPNLMYLFFGRKSILSSTTFWQSILYPPIFVRTIDIALDFLFKWKCTNITLNQKLAAYTHLYSYTSVKSVVHWFQIIRNRSFQMYDDDITASFGNRSFYKVAKFPTRNITAPIVLVYGGCDSLVDINIMLKELPPHTIAHEVPHFEHLDFLWGKDVKELVFPHVLDALDTYSYDPEGNDENGFIKYYQSPTGAKGNLLEPKNDAGPGRATPDSLPNYSEKGSGNDGEAPNGTTEANEQAEAELTAEEALTPMLAPVFELYEVATDLNEVTTEQILESMVEPTAADTVLPTPPPSSPLNEEVLVEALIASHHTKYPQISRESSPLSYSSTSNRRAGTPPLYAKSEPDQDSNPPTPPGLIYPPPRGPAAQNGGPLAYGSPISTKHAKSARSGSLGSLGIPDTSNRIGGGGITVGSVRPISSVTAINTVISEQNRTSPSTASGLAPPASSASSLASASASASPPSGPSFSPPTGPAADRASPPVGPRSLQKFRAGRSPYVASNSAFGANNTSFGGGRPVHHVPTNGHYQLPDEKDFSVGQRVAVHRNNRRRGRGRGRVSEIMPYRGNGEVRMGVEGSLYSDGMTVGARW